MANDQQHATLAQPRQGAGRVHCGSGERRDAVASQLSREEIVRASMMRVLLCVRVLHAFAAAACWNRLDRNRNRDTCFETRDQTKGHRVCSCRACIERMLAVDMSKAA
jgi:hypothetical protein